MRLLIGSTSPIMSSCNTVMLPVDHPVTSAAGSTPSPCQAREGFSILCTLRAARMEQDLFPTYLGQEVSSISEILDEGGFHLICHCCPVCAQGNPPCHQVDPTDTSATGSCPCLQAIHLSLRVENGARVGKQTQNGVRGAMTGTSKQQGRNLATLRDVCEHFASQITDLASSLLPAAASWSFLGAAPGAAQRPARWAAGMLPLPGAGRTPSLATCWLRAGRGWWPVLGCVQGSMAR